MLQLAVLPRAADIDLGRRLGEGEVGRAEAQRQVVDLEEGAAEIDQAALEMAHVGRAVDHQALDLMEHRRVGGVVVDAEGAARHDDAQRPAVGQHLLHVLVEHGARLHRRGVGAQHHRRAVGARRQVEGVLHLPRRMVGRDVERGEVVPVVLDVGTVGPGEAHLAEDGGELVHHLADRMQGALGLRAAPAG